jgi:hypothetical protein
MKTKLIGVAGAGIVALLTGCLSNRLALAPVGPDQQGKVMGGTNGYLQVYSATKKTPSITSDDPTFFALLTGYYINDAAGRSVRFVPNHMSNMDESPNEVKLAAGNYSIVAESTCCGLVAVPVVIENGKTTVVHLDRNWWPPANTQTNQLVFLPDGEVVGWTGSLWKSEP